MDSNISDKLSKILSDPQGMAQIMNLAKTLGESQQQTDNISQNQTAQQNLPGLSGAAPALDMVKSLINSPVGQAFVNGERERIQLLNALKPYLSQSKKEKLSLIISAMESVESISSIAKLL